MAEPELGSWGDGGESLPPATGPGERSKLPQWRLERSEAPAAKSFGI